MAVSPGKYIVKVRNSSLQNVGEVIPYKLQLNKRFNLPGAWQMTIADDDPLASMLATPGSGIYVLRNGQPYFSGPMWYVKRQGIASKLITFAGPDDLGQVMRRLAYPVVGDNSYQDFVAFNLILKEYPFGDTSGTTATDVSGFGSNGTYHGGFTLNQAALIDDPAKAVLLNGTTGYISVPTSGLPTGNSAFTMQVWFNYTGAPAATAVLCFIGTTSTASSAYMGILSSGIPTMQLKGTNFNGTSALSVGVHCMCLTYDGTTATLWVDDTIVKTATPGTCTLAYGVASFGCYGGGTSNFSPYTLQYGALYQGALGNASLPGSQLNGLSWVKVLYYVGKSRFAANTYDTETGPAETVIKTYVDFNAGPSATTERQVPNLVIEADAARGSTVTYDARFEPLVTKDGNGLLQLLANAGGVGFQVKQIAGPSLQFQVYVPNSNSAAKFSQGLGNLASYEYTIDAQDVQNFIVVAGGGTGAARTYVLSESTSSESSWGRAEGFVDGGSSTDRSQLANQGTSALGNAASKLSFAAEFIETEGVQFVTNFDLGDQVTVVVDGQELIDVVREVQAVLDQGTETLSIAIGTINYAQIQNVFGAFLKQAQQLSTRLALLERV